MAFSTTNPYQVCFPTKWVKLIMLYVLTVSYSIILNGYPRGYIIPSRTLRQGDPLSPFIFILCTERLSTLIAQRESKRLINGISICSDAPSVNHLLFANDSLLFCHASDDECKQIGDVLKFYEGTFRQQVNLQKSEIFFSRNVKRPMQMRMAGLLGVKQVDRHDMYLGMPTLVGQNKTACFSYIRNRLWKQLLGWKGKLLSAAKKEVLVKAVAQAIPNYKMSYFLIPKHFCDDLNKLIASFWWNGDKGERKLHWCSWERLCIPK